MAGLLGIIQRYGGGAVRAPAAAVRSAAASALHSPVLGAKILLESAHHACSAIYHLRDPGNCDSASAGSHFVALYGRVRRNDTSDDNLSAARLLELLLDKGVSILDELSGSYQLVVFDGGRQEAIIQNDRQATLPMYYAHGEGWFAFAPEAKCFFAAGLLDAQIDPQSAACFLREGLVLPGQSIFKRVSRMSPGQRIRIDLRDAQSTVATYWQLRFEADTSIGLDDAADELYRRVLDGHRREVTDAPDQYGLFLTGGIDSRGIAGSLDAIGSRPRIALTWCGRTDLKNSDPDIAAKIAGHYGYPHRVVRLDPVDLVTHAAAWVHVSELVTDNTGFMLAPVDVFNDESTEGLKFMLVGDELFGHGHAPRSFEEGVRYVLKSAYRDCGTWLRGCLDENAAALSDQAMAGEIARSAGDTRDQPRDVIDHLTYQVHRPCWSFSAGNSKEPGIPVRRPFLQDAIVRLTAALPAPLRNDKLVYYRMLHTRLPRAKRFPRTSADSLFDWPAEFRARSATRNLLKRSISAGLLDSRHLVGVVDSDGVQRFADRYFSEKAGEAKVHRSYGHHAVNVRRWVARIPGVKGLVSRLSSRISNDGKPASIEATTLVKRLAMLGMLVELIEQGRFDRPA